MFDRRLIANIDWVLLILILTAAGLGIMNLYSSTSTWNMTGTPIYVKQSYWLGLGFIIALIVALFDYRHLEYVGTWFLLAITWSVMTGFALWRMKRRQNPSIR